MEHAAEVADAVVSVLLGLAHVGVPDPVDQLCRAFEVFRHTGSLVAREEFAVLLDPGIDFFVGKRGAVEQPMVRLQRFLDAVHVEIRKSERSCRKGG